MVLVRSVTRGVTMVRLIRRLTISLQQWVLVPLNIIAPRDSVRHRGIFSFVKVRHLVAGYYTHDNRAIWGHFTTFLQHASGRVTFNLFRVVRRPQFNFTRTVTHRFWRRVVLMFVTPIFRTQQWVTKRRIARFLRHAIDGVQARRFRFLRRHVNTSLRVGRRQRLINTWLVGRRRNIFTMFFHGVMSVPIRVFPNGQRVFRIDRGVATSFNRRFQLINTSVGRLLVFFHFRNVGACYGSHRLPNTAEEFGWPVEVNIVAYKHINFGVAGTISVIVVINIAAVIARVIVFSTVVVRLTGSLLQHFTRVGPRVIRRHRFTIFVCAHRWQRFNVHQTALRRQTTKIIAGATSSQYTCAQ